MSESKSYNYSKFKIILKNIKVLIFSISSFFIFCGMKIILKDGNFLEISKFEKFSDFIRIEIKREKIDIPVYLIDIKSTMKLMEIESQGFSILKNYSSLIYEKKEKEIYSFSSDNDEKIGEKKAIPKIKLETRKESNPFFMELPDQKIKDEDFIDRIKKKGIFLKFNIPVKQ